jgi:hypothetical protein
MTEINAQISIISSYDDSINIIVEDKDAGVRFLDMTLTRAEFVNAAMNRQACVNVSKTEVFALDKIGKKKEYKEFEFEIPITTPCDEKQKEITIGVLNSVCPEGWVPDTYFGSQDSFFSKDGKKYARTMIRRWVDKP